MKRLFILSIAIFSVATIFAQSLTVFSGEPLTRKTAEPVVGALVTMTSTWDRDTKFQRVTTENGFQMVIPSGSYVMAIEKEGYETFSLEIDIEGSSVELGTIRMFTVEQAIARDSRKKK